MRVALLLCLPVACFGGPACDGSEATCAAFGASRETAESAAEESSLIQFLRKSDQEIGSVPCPRFDGGSAHLASCGTQAEDAYNMIGFCQGPSAGTDAFCEMYVPDARPPTVISIYNSWGCNACPQEQFDGIRYPKTGLWYHQKDIFSAPALESSVNANGTRQVTYFNGLGAHLIASRRPTGMPESYTTSVVDAPGRKYKWAPGRQVYQLVNGASGEVWTLHMSKGISVFSPSLLTLGQSLPGLPPSWSYRCKVLAGGGLTIGADEHGAAKIVLDEVGNIYQFTPELVTPGCPLYTDDECVQETPETRTEHCDRLFPGMSLLESRPSKRFWMH